MLMKMIYLDSNATTRPHDDVVNAMVSALTDHWQNPSSIHRAGQSVRQRVELAREDVARLLSCRPREIVFTSGGTEADNLVLHGALAAGRGRRIIVTNRMEHSAIRETALKLDGGPAEVIWLESDENGVIRIDQVQDIVSKRGGDIALVSIMWANNETGVIQPMDRIAAICREHGVLLHSDGVQAVGKIDVDLERVPVDLLSFAAHKFYGPKGVGGLFIRRGVHIAKQMIGGPHEREMRAGTENVPGIIGMGAACGLARQWLASGEPARIRAIRDRFEHAILNRIPECVINGGGAPRVWNTSNLGFPRLESEAILLMLSERGVCAAAGAACSSGSLEPSPVLLAMGIEPRIAHGSVRFSLSRYTRDEEIDEACEVIPAVIERLRRTITV